MNMLRAVDRLSIAPVSRQYHELWQLYYESGVYRALSDWGPQAALQRVAEQSRGNGRVHGAYSLLPDSKPHSA